MRMRKIGRKIGRKIAAVRLEFGGYFIENNRQFRTHARHCRNNDDRYQRGDQPIFDGRDRPPVGF